MYAMFQCYYLFSQVKKVWRELSEAVDLAREGTAQLSDVLSQVMVAQRYSVHCSQPDQLYKTSVNIYYNLIMFIYYVLMTYREYF